MAGKNKKRKKKTRRLSSGQLLKTGRDALGAQSYKSAIERFKQLLKAEESDQNRALLAKAYDGRASELLEKNLFTDALLVLDSRQKFCHVETPRDLHIRLLLGAGKTQEAAREIFSSQNNGFAARGEAIEIIAALALRGGDDLDRFIPAGHSVSTDKKIVLESLRALAESDDARCNECLKKIGFRSPLKDFRFFISGLLAFYSDDKEEAGARLKRIPESSALYALSSALAKFISRENGQLQRRMLMMAEGVGKRFLIDLQGVDDRKLKALGKITQALKREDYRSVFAGLRKSLDLFEKDALRQFCLRLLPYDIDRVEPFTAMFGELSSYEYAQVNALSAEQDKDLADMIYFWKKCLDSVDETSFPDPAERDMAKAILLRKIAAMKCTKEAQDDNEDDWEVDYLEDDDEFEPDIEEDDDTPWIEHLEESLKYDPANKETFEAIFTLYENSKNKKRAKFWREKMLAQFPKDIDVLLLNAKAAFDRKAYKSALDLLDRLLEIDPINSQAIETKIAFHVAKARKHVDERKYHLARREFEGASEIEDAKDRDGLVKIKWGLVELLAGEKERGASLLEQGKEEHGDHAGTYFLLDMEARRMKLKPRLVREERTHLCHLLAEQPASSEVAALLVNVFKPFIETEFPKKHESELLLRLYLQKAKYCGYEESALMEICNFLFQIPYDDLLEDYAEQGARLFPDAYRFAWMHLRAKCGGSIHFLSKTEIERAMSIVKEAAAADDMETVDEIKEAFGALFSFGRMFDWRSPFRRRKRRFLRTHDLPGKTQEVENNIRVLLGGEKKEQMAARKKAEAMAAQMEMF